MAPNSTYYSKGMVFLFDPATHENVGAAASGYFANQAGFQGSPTVATVTGGAISPAVQFTGTTGEGLSFTQTGVQTGVSGAQADNIWGGNVSGKEISLAVRFSPTSVTSAATRQVMSWTQNGTQALLLIYITTAGAITGHVRNSASGSQKVITGPTVTAGGVYNAVLRVKTNGDVDLFVNGVKYATQTGFTGVIITTGFTLGGHALNSAERFNGLLGTCGFFSQALDDTDCLAISNNTGVLEAAGADTTAPTLTGSIAPSAITQTSYTISWPAGADNVAVTGYEYRLNAGSWVDVGDVLTAGVTGRTAGTTDTVEVRAYDAAGNKSTPALSTTVDLLAVPVSDTVTLSEPLKNNVGTVWASQTGVKCSVLRATDFGSAYETSTATTNGSGLLSALTGGTITAGQQYHVVVKLTDGSVGISGPVTAS